MTAVIGWMVLVTLAGGALVIGAQLLSEVRQSRRLAPHPRARSRKESAEDHAGV
jgi:hypothetical protein